MQRYFNTSGPNNPKQHYTLMRKALVEKGLDMVEKDRYFTIWAPRQSGKSTYFRLLTDKLLKQGYKVCHINIENFQNATELFLCHFICQEISRNWQVSISATNLSEFYGQINNLVGNRCVFIIDEIEGLNPSILGQFLHTIRNLYHSRTQHALKSVILVGVSNITGIVENNASPFNIADSFNLPYFTKNELYELFAQHEAETGQLFAAEVKEKIYEITAGQPGLINGFGLQLTENNPDKKELDYEDYLKVEDWYLHQAIDKNVANIINKAKQRKNFIESLLFLEKKKTFEIDNEDIRYLYVNGVVKRDDEGNVEFWVPLYKKRLLQYFYPYMNGESEKIQGNINIEDYFLQDGQLNLDKIMRGYQEYAARRGFRYFIEKDENNKPKGLREAALMYSFETYIQSFLQVLEGKSYLEAHTALGRSDLIINIRGQEVVIEGKIYYNIIQFEKGKKQLAYYIKSLGLTKGVYVVFVNSEITHPKVLESVEQFDNVEITCYLVRYDLETDFGD